MASSTPATPTFTVEFQPPPQQHLRTYNRSLPAASQPDEIPVVFLGALRAREIVFIDTHDELTIEDSTDFDDARSSHWTAFSASSPVASTPATLQDLISRAIGTVRLMPYPQMRTHPLPGAQLGIEPGPVLAIPASQLFFEPTPSIKTDRASKLHDGIEPYVKIGRMCVLKEWRGQGIMTRLLEAALGWLGENSDWAVDRSTDTDGKLGKFNGLICAHAAETAMKSWLREGFVVDEEIGHWYMLGAKHICMWKRIEIKTKP